MSIVIHQMARTVDPRTRPALLGAASDLFYSRGLAATGVEEIAMLSRLTKPTLYRHFPSKDSLVAAYLDDRHQRLDAELRGWVAAAVPRRRPQAVIDWLCDWLARPGFKGCAFVRASAELPDDGEVRARARRRKRTLHKTVLTACESAGVAEPQVLAGQLFLIIEGATTAAFISGGPGTAIAAARSLGRLALIAAGLGEADA
jgi:AcrR family transcriptional regulator